MSEVRQHVLDLDPDTLAARLTSMQMPPHASGQILDWVYRHLVDDAALMTNIAARNREAIAAALTMRRGVPENMQVASDGTTKVLIRWDGGPRTTETVLIPSGARRTACVSSQVGCPVRCTFCASGMGGLEGNLTSGQIVEQVLAVEKLAGERVTNVVFMGMGEPLANYDAVTGALRTLRADWGCGIGARRMTVSTVGIPVAIRRLATFELPVTLALSLHAPNDDLRRSLIPWAHFASISEILDACQDYFVATGREVTLEYLLLRDVNDGEDHARELVELCRSLRCNVNLIRYNEVPGLAYRRPVNDRVHAFQKVLRDAAVNTHIRASRGRDIDAACGQLRRGV
ncbi:MAG: 23S rRNA (adenine(2503)-C(2))-methyltransferase RlmN [Phycisphaerales bacterium]|nr:23S rRNA (adenine(2503)-C(2))-methyltransferase RlmN [Phycisphaerales bacterium]